MKKKALVPMILVLILATASVAMARNGYRLAGYHNGNWAAYNQLTPEKQQQVQSIFKKYEDTFQTLRTQQWAKRTELNALVDSGKADKESIQTLVKELGEIKAKVYAEHKKMAEELEKETGLTFPAMGQGSGRGCGNYRGGGCPGGGGNYGNNPAGCPGGNCPGQGS